MVATQASARTLVAHDGELGDVCDLLAELRAPYEERRGRPVSQDSNDGCELVIASPQRLLERRTAMRGAQPTRIAVAQNATRTLVSMLRRTGVDFVVRQPVHPTALRLLLLHVLYCGPEKRRRERVSVGAAVRFRTRILRRKAILAELSVRGCRLLSPHAVRRDAGLQLFLDAALSGGKPLTLRGRVVRTGPASGEEAGTQAMAVVFESLTRETVRRLQTIVGGFAKGPATWSGRPDTKPKVHGDRETRAAAEAGAGADATTADDDRDRRAASRHAYEHSVIALGEQATRVLLGRDISMGGMRIDPHGELAVDDDLRIALHVGGRSEPLVVRARVGRDDGRRGLVLQFVDLAQTERHYLEKMVDSLPVLAANPDDETGGGGIVVSEILEHCTESSPATASA